jgi:hypothetical protein
MWERDDRESAEAEVRPEDQGMAGGSEEAAVRPRLFGELGTGITTRDLEPPEASAAGDEGDSGAVGWCGRTSGTCDPPRCRDTERVGDRITPSQRDSSSQRSGPRESVYTRRSPKTSRARRAAKLLRGGRGRHRAPGANSRRTGPVGSEGRCDPV